MAEPDPVDLFRERYVQPQGAVLAPVMRYFDGAIRGLRKRDRMTILRATDDFWTVMETLSLAPVAESAELKVRLRGALAKRKLLQMDGGVLASPLRDHAPGALRRGAR